MWYIGDMITNAMNLKQRISNLVARADAAKKVLDAAEKIDWEWLDKETNEMEAELSAIDKAAGPGLNVGRVLTFGVADGNASYIITKIRKNDVIVEWVPMGDNYWSQAVGLTSDKRNHCVLRSTAEHYCRF